MFSEASQICPDPVSSSGSDVDMLAAIDAHVCGITRRQGDGGVVLATQGAKQVGAKLFASDMRECCRVAYNLLLRVISVTRFARIDAKKLPSFRQVRGLSLRASELLPRLQEEEHKNPAKCKSLWRPEFAAYMIEGTPGQPYGSLLSHLNTVEANMRARRRYAQRLLQEDEHLVCLTTFFRLGRGKFTSPVSEPHWDTSYLRSISFPDEAVFSEHPRFKTLARSIYERRGKKVVINVPIFKDVKTPNPFIEDDAGCPQAKEAIKPDHIYMDAMGFEARRLYDQLAPICPVVMALSAASPVFRGYLAERDCRWDVIGDSVDCRRDDEKERIKKSRYGSIDCYISDKGEHFNDINVVYNKEYYEKLRSNGVNHLLAQVGGLVNVA
ncbi:glutamate--cysteine ligase-like [Tropilaelaps mercedesae]|uniref:Glutamate--cysteine ligase n=1 Tax=Tropilaelaps mercedesae TaxID=418985 RepID=A0A1V9Y203_9ACAR|nr:glutamate--cysteine ligase-like [Tropilaelaps mercedesae]